MKPRYPMLTLLTISACLFFYAFGADGVLQYDRTAIFGGELWRLLTAHMIHFSLLHLLFNTGAFTAAGWIIERRNYPAFGSLLAVSALCISVVMLLWLPDMHYYGGLSGIVHAVLFYLALWEAVSDRESRNIARAFAWILLMKVTLEFFYGDTLLTSLEPEVFVAVPLSHVIGVAVAMTWFTMIALMQRRRTVLSAAM